MIRKEILAVDIVGYDPPAMFPHTFYQSLTCVIPVTINIFYTLIPGCYLRLGGLRILPTKDFIWFYFPSRDWGMK